VFACYKIALKNRFDGKRYNYVFFTMQKKKIIIIVLKWKKDYQIDGNRENWSVPS